MGGKQPNEKIDLYKENKAEYGAGKTPRLIEVGRVQYLAFSGQGAPGSEAFQDAMAALYGMAFTIKMTRKFAGKGDYVVCKLEGIYFPDGDADFADTPPDQWRWKMMIRTPDFVGQDDMDDAVGKLLDKGKTPAVKDVALETLAEGRCVQMLHVGPYEKEGETIAVMEQFVAEQGLRVSGPHHEIYLSDPRRVAPERLKTILRLPVSSR